MSDWVPEGSVPYRNALGADGESRPRSHGAELDESVPRQAIAWKRPKPPRHYKKCWGNDNTCESWKAQGTDFCVGHLKSIAKEADGGTN